MVILLLGAASALADRDDREIAELLAPDGEPGDGFGYAVAIDGDVALVGAPWDDDLGPDSGSVYVFVREIPSTPQPPQSRPRWSFRTKLTAAGGMYGDHFGISLALRGDIAAVGAPGADAAGLGNLGSVRILRRHDGGPDQWGEIRRLHPPLLVGESWFGFAIAMAGSRLVVGAPTWYITRGAAFLFAQDEGGPDQWGMVARLEPSPPSSCSSSSFGWRVAIDGETIAVGATKGMPHDEDGSVHIFNRDCGGADRWGEVGFVLPPGGCQLSQFGWGMALAGDVLAVSQVVASPLSLHIFARDEGGPDAWGLRKSISIEECLAVALDEDLLLGGSVEYPAYVRAYVQDLDGVDAWGVAADLNPSSPAYDFGESISIAGHDIIIGGSFESETAWVFDFSPANTARAVLRNDGGNRNPVSYSGGRPAIGDTVAATVDLSTTGHSLALLFGTGGPAEIPLAGGQVLLCAMGEILLLTPPAAGPQAFFELAIPDDPRLFGVRLSTQALHFGGIAPFALSNAQDLRLGYGPP
ncbi:MAG: FG-GAP repeat protein [Planctomycetota bacterium]